jgi:glycosyltransferase involved in cell wall biosynthesis
MKSHTIKNSSSGIHGRHGDRIRLCYVITSPLTSRFLRGQLRYMQSHNYEVTLISAPGADLAWFKQTEDIEIITVPMEREIHLFRDIRALFQLYCVFRAIRPHIVNAGTPKAGLLALVAAFFARVPVRIYTVRGLRLETATGIKRRILSLTERVASACAQRVIAVSRSLADEYLKLGLTAEAKLQVLAGGSSNGVKPSDFEPTPSRRTHAVELRDRLGIAHSEPVIGFVGRLTRDKGIEDLVQAFLQLSHTLPQSWLILVGGVEKDDTLDEATLDMVRKHPRIVSTGFVQDAAIYYHMMNVLAFPSYREGFPNAVLEAQAAGIPVVGYRATGVVDAIADGITGRLVPMGASEDLAQALGEYLSCPELAVRHGAWGRHRVEHEFSNERVWNALLEEYRELSEKMGLAISTRETCPQIGTRAA